MKLQKKEKKEIACMPALKTAFRRNAGQLAGYAVATAGQIILQSVVVIELLRFISDELGAGGKGIGPAVCGGIPDSLSDGSCFEQNQGCFVCLLYKKYVNGNRAGFYQENTVESVTGIIFLTRIRCWGRHG